MKKALVLVICVLGFVLIAAPTAVESHQVFVNGRLLGNAIVVQGGIIAVSVEDISKALGGTVAMPATLKIDGMRLVANAANIDPAAKKAVLPTDQTALKQNQDTTSWKLSPGQFLRVQKGGVISSHIITEGGRKLVSVNEFAHALGMANYTGGTHTGGSEPIRLNSNSTGILVGL